MYFYHVSKNNALGDEWLHPKIPSGKMTMEDDTVRRICVSPSINGCLTATGGYEVGDRLVVYRCITESFTQPSYDQVADAPLTGELWIKEPVRFELFMEIVITAVYRSQFVGLQNDFFAFEKISKRRK